MSRRSRPGRYSCVGIQPKSLREVIQEHGPRAVEAAVAEELTTALGAAPYWRTGARRGYRNARKARPVAKEDERCVLARSRLSAWWGC